VAYQISWLVEGCVVEITFSGTATVEELHNQALSLVEYLDKGQQPLVHNILNLTELEHFPINLALLNNNLSAPLRHPKIGWNIFITSNRMAKFLASMVTQLSSARFRSFATREEGLAFLNEVDSTLPNLLELKPDNKS
jgi:hypothetical protein